MEYTDINKCFTGNRLKNSAAISGLQAVQSVIEKIGKTKGLADFRVSDYEPQFLKILQNEEAAKFVFHYATQYSLNNSYSPSVASPDFAHLLVNDLCQLYLGRLEPSQTKRNVIFTAPCNFLFAPINRGANVAVKKYLLPSDWSCEIYNSKTELRLVEEFYLHAGEFINIPRNGNCISRQNDGTSPSLYMYDFEVEKPVIWLRLASQATSAYQWVFHKDTLMPSFMSSSSLAQTRYETIIKVINSFHESGLNNPTYLDVLESLTKSPLHHIRWMAAQGLFSASQERGAKVVKELTHDIHPHVKQAALIAMDQLAKSGVTV